MDDVLCAKHPNKKLSDYAVSIDTYETRTDPIAGKPYTVFMVSVKTCCSAYVLCRRYSEFVELHKNLMTKYTRLPKLPPKKLLGSSMDSEFVNMRRNQLEAYARALVAEPELAQSRTLGNFLAKEHKEDLVGALCEQYVDLKRKQRALADRVKKMEKYLKTVVSPHFSKQSVGPDGVISEVIPEDENGSGSEKRNTVGGVSRTVSLPAAFSGSARNAASGSRMALMEQQVSGLKRMVRQLQHIVWGRELLSDEELEDDGFAHLESGRTQSSQAAFNHSEAPSKDTQRSFSQRIVKRDYPGSGVVEVHKDRTLSASSFVDRAALKHYNYHTTASRAGSQQDPWGDDDGPTEERSKSKDWYGRMATFAKPTGMGSGPLAVPNRVPAAATDKPAADSFSPHIGNDSLSSPSDIVKTCVNLVLDTDDYSSSAGFKRLSAAANVFNPAATASASTSTSSSGSASGSTSSSSTTTATVTTADPSQPAPSSSSNGTTEANGATLSTLSTLLDSIDPNSSSSATSSSTASSSSSSSSASTSASSSSSTSSSTSVAISSSSALKIPKAKSSISGGLSPSVSISGNVGNTSGRHSLASSPSSRTRESKDVLGQNLVEAERKRLEGEEDGEGKKKVVGLRVRVDDKDKPGSAGAKREKKGKGRAARKKANEDDSTVASTATNDEGDDDEDDEDEDDDGADERDEEEEEEEEEGGYIKPSSLDSPTFRRYPKLLAKSPPSLNSAPQPLRTAGPVNSTATIIMGAGPGVRLTSAAISIGSAANGLRPTDRDQEWRELCEQYVLEPELNAKVKEVLALIEPTASTEYHFDLVKTYVQQLVSKSLGSEVHAHGSFALKTYLPDSDLDLSAFFSRGHENNWVQKIVTQLCQEAHSTQADPRLQVKSVTFVNAECRVIKCQIGRLSVDISGNQVGALAALALFEEVDLLVGKNHLFKRTVLLAKAWAMNEGKLTGSHRGFLSSYCLRAIVLFIFNAFHAQLQTPLQGLCKMLMYLEHFNWDEHALGLYGPIKLNSLPQLVTINDGPCAWPAGVTPLLSKDIVSAYSHEAPIDEPPPVSGLASGGSTASTATTTGTGTTTSPPAIVNRTFPRKFLNVFDPNNPINNLGRSVAFKNASLIRQAFVEGAVRFRTALLEWGRQRDIEADELDVAEALVKQGQKGADERKRVLVNSFREVRDRQAEGIVASLFSQTVSRYSGHFYPPPTFSYKSESHPGSPTESPKIGPETFSPSTRMTIPKLRLPMGAPPPSQAFYGGDQPNENKDLLDADLPNLLDNLNHARRFEMPDITEDEIVSLVASQLREHGPVPVGKMGSMLHAVTNNHSLPAMLKERYGGLKRLLQRHEDVFGIGDDHPYNPHVFLKNEGQRAPVPGAGRGQQAAGAAAGGAAAESKASKKIGRGAGAPSGTSTGAGTGGGSNAAATSNDWPSGKKGANNSAGGSSNNTNNNQQQQQQFKLGLGGAAPLTALGASGSAADKMRGVDYRGVPMGGAQGGMGGAMGMPIGMMGGMGGMGMGMGANGPINIGGGGGWPGGPGQAMNMGMNMNMGMGMMGMGGMMGGGNMGGMGGMGMGFDPYSPQSAQPPRGRGQNPSQQQQQSLGQALGQALPRSTTQPITTSWHKSTDGTNPMSGGLSPSSPSSPTNSDSGKKGRKRRGQASRAAAGAANNA